MKNLIAAIIFAFGFILLFVLVFPQFDAIGAAKDTNAAEQILLNDRTTELNNFKKLDTDAKTHQADINKILVFLPPGKQIDALVSSIQKVAGDSGIQLNNVITSESTITGEDTGYKTALINLELVGQYPAFINFLRLLEQNLRLYDITEVTAGLNAGAAGESINFSVKLKAYYLK